MQFVSDQEFSKVLSITLSYYLAQEKDLALLKMSHLYDLGFMVNVSV